MRYTEAPMRRDALLRRLADAGYVSSRRVADELGVSDMTIRRDLRQLHDEGLARRVPGGAARPGSGEGAQPFEERTTHHMPQKRAVARAALTLTAGAGSLALDAGTTVAAAAAWLPAGVTVVTHSLPVLTACGQRTDLRVIALGGAYEPSTRSFTGPATRAALADLEVDVVLLSTVALSSRGLYCTNPLDAETKRLLIAAAARVVLLADHTKTRARAPLRFGTLDAVDVVVTDSGIAAHDLAMLRDAVPDVLVAEVGGG